MHQNLLVTFTQLNLKESKQFFVLWFNKEGRGRGKTSIPPERHRGFRGQLHRNWHGEVQFPRLHSHKELRAAGPLGGCQPVLAELLHCSMPAG